MNNPRLNNVSFILSPGTQIVALHEIKDEDRNIILPGGSVGVETVSPESQQSAYRVRFLNGIVLSVRHEQMVMLARFKPDLKRQNCVSLGNLLADRNIMRSNVARNSADWPGPLRKNWYTSRHEPDTHTPSHARGRNLQDLQGQTPRHDPRSTDVSRRWQGSP